MHLLHGMITLAQKWPKSVHGFVFFSAQHPGREWRAVLILVSRWIDGETGIRSDVPHNMIYPLKETRPNLHIVTGVHVKRAIFDEYVFHMAVSILARLLKTQNKNSAQRKPCDGRSLRSQPAIPSCRRPDRNAHRPRDKARGPLRRVPRHAGHTGALGDRRQGRPRGRWDETAR